MKRQTLVALFTSVCVLAACSDSEPSAPQQTSAPASVENVASEASAAAPAAEMASTASTAEVAPASVEAKAEEAAPAGLSKDEQIQLGKAVYEANCMACHGAEGKGVEGMFPPLAQSDYFAKDSNKVIHAVTKGVNGKITVNGKEFNGVMPPLPLSDQDAANAITYVLNSFGNAGGQVSAADVAAVKAQ